MDYRAFYENYHELYLLYAQARIPWCTAAADVVSAAFDDIAFVWTTALSSPSAAALAWGLLRQRVAGSALCPSCRPACAHCVLRPAMADAVVLHTYIGISLSETATVMGLNRGDIGALLCGARRRLVDSRRLVRAMSHMGLQVEEGADGRGSC
ncbi:hypothetical protein AB0E62_37810 [Streptomyces sp. NPDC038707]|uniref:hypothetical protein n=1 Tax=Streptomyces sp. NPDC038707 TaxID=3154329 RepID=UPI00340A5D37